MRTTVRPIVTLFKQPSPPVLAAKPDLFSDFAFLSAFRRRVGIGETFGPPIKQKAGGSPLALQPVTPEGEGGQVWRGDHYYHDRGPVSGKKIVKKMNEAAMARRLMIRRGESAAAQAVTAVYQCALLLADR